MESPAFTPCTRTPRRVTEEEALTFLAAFKDWEVIGTDFIRKTFPFKNHYEVMAFVNAVAWISNRQNHHPNVDYVYNAVTLAYSTHDIGNKVSDNDLLCAAKVEALLKL